ncbi:MAG: paraquat-inducible protein A [Saprospiraceae bacterium]|nr:paraquat-inducible protein A [Saprospiraceae bacterium]
MRLTLSLLILAGLLFGAFRGYQLRELTKEQTEYKEVLAEINRINYGLFNMELWKEKAVDIFSKRIADFQVPPKAYVDIDAELQVYLTSLYKEWLLSGKLVNMFIDEAEKSGNLNKYIANMAKDYFNKEMKNFGLESKIPGIAETLTAEIKRNEPMLAGYLKQGLQNLLFEDNPMQITDLRQPIYQHYGHTTLQETNEDLSQRVSTLENQINKDIKVVYAIVLGLVVLCFFTYGAIGGTSTISLISFASIILLFLGVTMPMIDIDARLNGFQMNLVGSTVSFDQQYMYYQSKSILDVTSTLIRGRGIDLKIVGIMILLFSVVVPFIKLVLSSIFLYSNKIRNSKVAKTIIYHLGKWSMADVFVVAMFMAYIGFYGIITAQLGEIGNNKTGYAVETLNYSRLSPGALFFTTYCVLSIITGILINRWESKQTKLTDS